MYYAYMHKENRDRMYRELKALGVKNLRRFSFHNQLTHPMYVDDWPGPTAESSHRTHFKSLYVVEGGVGTYPNQR